MKNLLRKSRSFRSVVTKTARVATYLGVVVAGLSVVGVRAVHAKTRSAALAIGEPLGNIEVPPGGGNVLTVNGAKLHLAVAHVDGTVPAVLDRIQHACESHADGLADDLGAMEHDFATTKPSARGFPGVGLLRDERVGRGVVACFAPGEQVDKIALAKRLAKFAKTSDLEDLGGLRYVAVHEEPEGGVKVTSTWADDSLSIGAMFPETGDAAGNDPRYAPRPAKTQRLMSATVEPAPYGAWVYGTNEAPEAAMKSYEAALAAKGFKVVAGTEPLARSYQNGLVDVLVTASAGTEGTTLSVIESSYLQARASGGGR